MSKRVDFLKFNTFEALVGWLTTTKWGANAIREALYSRNGERFYAEFVERELCLMELPARPTYVLVRAFGDGWIEVYGERHVRAKIIELPATENAAQEKLLDDWVSVNIKLPYQEIDFPSCKRAAAFVPPFLGFGEFVTGLVDRDTALAFLKGCSKIRESLPCAK